jgi:hypothetical protein
MSGDGHENHDQPQDTVYRIFTEYNHHRTEQGQGSQEPKKDFVDVHGLFVF